MRISFVDGTAKGIRDDVIVSKKIGASLIEVTMKDGAEFTFPTCNVKEIKVGGKIEDNKE